MPARISMSPDAVRAIRHTDGWIECDGGEIWGDFKGIYCGVPVSRSQKQPGHVITIEIDDPADVERIMNRLSYAGFVRMTDYGIIATGKRDPMDRVADLPNTKVS